MSEKFDDHGPLWQIESQVKHYASLIQTYRSDANNYLRKADDAERKHKQYLDALKILKESQA